MSGILNITGLPPSEADVYYYGYIPQERVAIIFVVLFGVAAVTHIVQAAYYKLWWLYPTVIAACIGEILGWAGRLWSSREPQRSEPYLMHHILTATVLAPTPLLAADFIILSSIVEELPLGERYSWLTPRRYTAIFLSSDVIALAIQAVGGGLVSGAQTLALANRYAHIVLAGILFQLVVIILFSVLGIDLVRRYIQDKPVRGKAERQLRSPTKMPIPKRLKWMLAVLAVSIIALFIRSIYRTVELSDGWSGRIIETEVYFNVFDGSMVIIAVYAVMVGHPGLLLGLPGREAMNY
ncbi:RTA1 like protein-domain-containing protein [Roridomyces roridus]|uniref:RTA1 like protein-domain-containing protein n=1 Tax=Roridomyces roridus TaxID=1738132 RepID=A0AAD7B1M6_9AGAR|nr:RTA1 like protein-domain-containing protein [Roridomyces roridus]